MLLEFLKKTFFVLLVFIYVFGPPFAIFPFSADKLIHGLFLISLPFYSAKYGKLLRYPIVSLTIVIQVIICAYTLIQYLFNPSEYNYILQSFLMLTEVLVSSLFFVVMYLEWFNTKSATTYDFLLHAIIIITLVQGVISLFGVLDPKLNLYINNNLLFYQKTYNFGISYRGVGMSDDYFFTMPIVQGIGIVCCLYFVFQEKYLYLLPIPLMLLSISFNARIGFTPMVIFLVLSMIFFFKKSDVKPRTILWFIALVTIIVLFFNPDMFWKSKLNQGVTFGYSFFDATSKFLFSDKYDETANYKVLRDMVFFPDHDKLLFGTGESIFFSNQRNSDIGYINQLFYGGIVYLFLQFAVLFTAFFYVFKSMKFNPENLKMKVFLLVCLFTFLVSNVKGYFFLVKPGLRLIYLIFFLVYFINISMKSDARSQ